MGFDHVSFSVSVKTTEDSLGHFSCLFVIQWSLIQRNHVNPKLDVIAHCLEFQLQVANFGPYK